MEVIVVIDVLKKKVFEVLIENSLQEIVFDEVLLFNLDLVVI